MKTNPTFVKITDMINDFNRQSVDIIAKESDVNVYLVHGDFTQFETNKTVYSLRDLLTTINLESYANKLSRYNTYMHVAIDKQQYSRLAKLANEINDSQTEYDKGYLYDTQTGDTITKQELINRLNQFK